MVTMDTRKSGTPVTEGGLLPGDIVTLRNGETVAYNGSKFDVPVIGWNSIVRDRYYPHGYRMKGHNFLTDGNVATVLGGITIQHADGRIDTYVQCYLSSGHIYFIESQFLVPIV